MNELPRTLDLTGIDRSMRSLAGRRWTTAELLARVEAGLLDPDEDFELIHGEVVPIRRRGRDHENLRSDLTDFIFRHLTEVEGVRTSASPQLDLADDTYRKPAIMVRPASIAIYDVRGSDALLVIDISDPTLAKDRRLEPTLYASFDVREYWLIGARSRMTWVHRGPSARGFADVCEVASDQMLAPMLVPGLAFRLDEVGMQDD